MSEPKTGSFAAIAAARVAAFISYREVVTKLAEETGDSYSQIAAELKAARLDLHGTVYLTGRELALSNAPPNYSDTVSALLDFTIEQDVFEPDWLVSRGADPDRCGWIRESFIEVLREKGLPCPASLNEPPPYKARTTRPGAKPRPRGDAELSQRLDEAESEIEALRAELAKHQDDISEAPRLCQQLEAARRDIERLEGERPAVEGRLRSMIAAVGREFWPEDDSRKHRPKADEILKWIRQAYPKLSEAEAACVERAACPVNRDRDPDRKAADAAKEPEAGKGAH